MRQKWFEVLILVYFSFRFLQCQSGGGLRSPGHCWLYHTERSGHTFWLEQHLPHHRCQWWHHGTSIAKLDSLVRAFVIRAHSDDAAQCPFQQKAEDSASISWHTYFTLLCDCQSKLKPLNYSPLYLQCTRSPLILSGVYRASWSCLCQVRASPGQAWWFPSLSTHSTLQPFLSWRVCISTTTWMRQIAGHWI